MTLQSKGLNAIFRHGLALLIVCWCGLVQAQVPRQLTYQGVLTNPGGVAVNATVTMVFKLYTAPAGGTAVYTETQSVTVANGIFNVLLGSVTPLTLPFDVPYFLGVSANADAEMTPRQLVTASGYALRAASADAVAPTASVPGSTVTGPISNPSATLPATNITGTIVTTQIANGAVTKPKLSATGGTAGQVLGTDGTNLVWQAPSGGGGGGGAVTGTSLAITGDGTIGGQFAINSGFLQVIGPSTAEILASAHNSIAIFAGQRAGGSPGAETAVTSGQDLSWFTGRGYTGSSYSGSRAIIAMLASENWTNSANGTEMAFRTTPNGSTSAAERMRITNAGKVLIGTTEVGNYGSPLHIVNNGSSAVIEAESFSGLNWIVGSKANGTASAPTAVQATDDLVSLRGRGLHSGGNYSASRAYISLTASENWTSAANGTEITFSTTANGTSGAAERLRIANDGSIGIGTSAPTKGKVQIDGFKNVSYLPGTLGYGDMNGFRTVPIPSQDVAVSLYASQPISAPIYIAHSDARIKRIEGRSDAGRDLATLAGIEVTDYTYIDTLTKGSGKQKKVIAQQVEKVFPQAVRRSTDVVPDIYQKAAVKDGWVTLATNLKKGERVRLIGAKKEGIHEVLDVAPGRFRTAFAADGDAVFVYGREVKDFRMVDYEAIAMLNVSATQELDRRLEQQADQLAAQSAELAAQTVRVAELEQVRLTQVARIDALETQVARIDALEMQAAELAALKRQVAQMVQVQQQAAGTGGVVAGLSAQQ